jgi:microcystin-dependent protein
MGTPWLSEIRIMSFSFAPKGWAQCNGQLLPINQNQALFSLLGTTYGGDGRQTFGLPDLRGRVPLSFGNGFTLGERGGEYAHTLIISELASHIHIMQAKNANADTGQGGPGVHPAPTKALAQALASQGQSAPVAVSLYGTGNPTTTFNAGAIGPAGGSQPHENKQPFLALNFCIALQGAFPSQN